MANLSRQNHMTWTIGDNAENGCDCFGTMMCIDDALGQWWSAENGKVVEVKTHGCWSIPTHTHVALLLVQFIHIVDRIIFTRFLMSKYIIIYITFTVKGEFIFKLDMSLSHPTLRLLVLFYRVMHERVYMASLTMQWYLTCPLALASLGTFLGPNVGLLVLGTYYAGYSPMLLVHLPILLNSTGLLLGMIYNSTHSCLMEPDAFSCCLVLQYARSH